MYINYNPNPYGARTNDCVIRALAKATGKDWYEVYIDLFVKGLEMGDMLASNAVWGSYLKDQGYRMESIPDTCPDCYTVKEFANDHSAGSYILGTGSHAVAVIDGDYFDTWDSGDEIPIYYFRR